MGEPRPQSLPTLQELVGAAERLRAREHALHGIGWLPLVEEALQRLRAEPFVANPIPAFVRQASGKERLLASPEPVERVIEEALLPRLQAAIEPLLSDAVHSYRRGRSVYTAATAAMGALASGLVEVAELDIADFFASIDRELLRAQLASVVEPWLAGVLFALVSAPLLADGQMLSPDRGIPLGRPVSPMLANFYLIDLDRAMVSRPGRYVRYGDDLLIAAETDAERDAAEAAIRDALVPLGLRLNDAKAAIFRYDGRPFLYLGHLIGDKAVYERVSDERLERIVTRPVGEPAGTTPDIPEPFAELPNRRSQTLYITEPGLYISVQKGLVVMKRGASVVREVPIRKIDRALVLAGGSMSSAFMSACIENQVPVLFFVGKGRAFGSLVAGGIPNPMRLRAQYDLLSQPGRRLSLARAVIDAKVRAMRHRLAGVQGAAEVRSRLQGIATDLGNARDIAVIRGLEGMATKLYYSGLALRIRPPAFAFKNRTKRPPRDPVNSLLSFSYSLVFGEMQTALLAEGLDPYPGLLHDLRASHPALASDLVEPYRALIADSFVLSLINNGRIKPEDFETQSTGAVYMKDEARRMVLHAYEDFIDRPAGRGRASPRRLLHGAARAMLRVVLGSAESLVLPFGSLQMEDEP